MNKPWEYRSKAMNEDRRSEEADRHRRNMGDGDAEAEDAGGEEGLWRCGFRSFVFLLLLAAVSLGGEMS